MTATGSSFSITESTGIYVQGEVSELASIGAYLAAQLSPATGFDFPVNKTEAAPKNGNIHLVISDNTELGEEGYELNITEDLLTISANKPAGIFYGIQTLRQLLPASIEASSVQTGPMENCFWNDQR